MAYKQQTIHFYGDPIVFLVNDKNAIVSMKSIVSGMGLNWGSQHRKIMKMPDNGRELATVQTYTGKRLALFGDRGLIEKYLYTIDLNSVREERKKRVKLYREQFLNFSYKSVLVEKQIEIENEYTDSAAGLSELIFDSVVALGNPNAISQIASVIDNILNVDITDVKVPFFERENCPKTRAAFRDLLSDLGLKISAMSDPIQDLAESTASKNNRLIEIKSKSPGARLEDLSDIARKYDNSLALAIKKIAKEVY